MCSDRKGATTPNTGISYKTKYLLKKAKQVEGRFEAQALGSSFFETFKIRILLFQKNGEIC